MTEWLVFQFVPVTLFSLKSSRATSTAGKTLLTPTPYAVKMAFLDAALRSGITRDPNTLVELLRGVSVQIGVPRHACVTGTIQAVRQEIHDVRKRGPETPSHRSTIALREFVHYQGTLRLAFEIEGQTTEFISLLIEVAPAINYLGKRGSFLQYIGVERRDVLDSSFTGPTAVGYRADLDDFGPGASFAAMNSFAPTSVRRDVDRRFVETIVPLQVRNSGPGFTHYVNGVS